MRICSYTERILNHIKCFIMLHNAGRSAELIRTCQRTPGLCRVLFSRPQVQPSARAQRTARHQYSPSASHGFLDETACAKPVPIFSEQERPSLWPSPRMTQIGWYNVFQILCSYLSCTKKSNEILFMIFVEKFRAPRKGAWAFLSTDPGPRLLPKKMRPVPINWASGTARWLPFRDFAFSMKWLLFAVMFACAQGYKYQTMLNSHSDAETTYETIGSLKFRKEVMKSKRVALVSMDQCLRIRMIRRWRGGRKERLDLLYPLLCSARQLPRDGLPTGQRQRLQLIHLRGREGIRNVESVTILVADLIALSSHFASGERARGHRKLARSPEHRRRERGDFFRRATVPQPLAVLGNERRVLHGFALGLRPSGFEFQVVERGPELRAGR